MSIVSTTIVSDITSGNTRAILYRCTDSEGSTHDYGPVFTTLGPAFDADAHTTLAATKMAAVLAEREANEVIG